MIPTNTPKETPPSSPFQLPLLHINRISLRTRLLLFLPNLDRLIRLARNQPRSRQIERAREDARLAIQRSRLHHGAFLLEAVPRFPVTEPEHSIVPSREQNALLIHRNRVQNVVVPAHIPQKLRLCLKSASHAHFRTLPLLDVVGRRRGEDVLPTLHALTRLYTGWNRHDRTPFLWCVRIDVAVPATKSHVRTVASADPVTTCGSPACVATQWTVPRWPPSTMISAFVRMSQTRQTLSRPPVSSTSSVGCVVMQYTPLRWPW